MHCTVTTRELEVFYHLVENKTFTATGTALGGIDQSAVSKHVAQLEAKLGGRSLYDRHEHECTREGRILFRFMRPFFVGIPAVIQRIIGGPTPGLQIDASMFVFQSCFGPALAELVAEFPNLPLALRTPRPQDVVARLRSGDSDFAITVCDEPPAGVPHVSLMNLPLAVLVPADSPIESVDDLVTGRHRCGPILCPPREDAVTQYFLRGCASLTAREPALLEVEAVALVPYLVATLGRVGVCPDYPPLYADKSVRRLATPKLPPLQVMALSRRRSTPALAFLLEGVIRHAARLKRGLAVAALERKQVAAVAGSEK